MELVKRDAFFYALFALGGALVGFCWGMAAIEIDKQQKEELNEEYNGSRRDYGGDSGRREGSIAEYDANACAAACAGTAVGQAVFLARQSARAYGGSFIKPGTCVDRRASGAAGGTAAATSYPDPGRAAGGIRL